MSGKPFRHDEPNRHSRRKALQLAALAGAAALQNGLETRAAENPVDAGPSVPASGLQPAPFPVHGLLENEGKIY